MKYNWPPAGRYEPFELHHYLGNYLSDTIETLREKGKPRLSFARNVICGLLERYADGTYTYEHSSSFNPKVASTLKDRVEATVRQSATVKDLSALAKSLIKTIDRHYLKIGQPHKTRKAIKKFKKELKAKRSK